MKFTTVYDKKGRMRVRYGAYAFDKYSSFGVADYIKSLSFVNDVKISTNNGSILISYNHTYKDKLMSVLNSLSKEKIKQLSYPVDEEMEKLNKVFKSKMYFMLAKKIVMPILFPGTIGKILTMIRSFKFLKNGVSSLLNGEITVDVLDATSITASILTNDYGTANSIMFLLNFFQLLEEYTMRSASLQLAKSLEINVDHVWVLEDGNEVKKPMSSIVSGDVVIARTGLMIPVDGTVVSGEAMVNEASMTGESLPVRKYESSTVFAGSVIEEGNLNIKVTAIDNQTRISKIIELIDKSQDLKANIQSRAQKTADSIVPFSLLSFALVYAFTRNITRAMAVLMVDYSCAIKLSTPIAVISAMKEASMNNIVVKGGKFLEEYANAKTIVFDKTGTLTNATPQLAKIIPFYGHSEDEVLKIAACLEEHFPHSVARAIVRAANNRNIIHEEDHAEVEYIVAHGISSKLNGKRALIGSRHFIEDDENIPLTNEQIEIIKRDCLEYSTLYLALGNKVIAIFCIDDPPRLEARDVISKLKEKGFDEIIMITGDNKITATSVCKKLGINRCYSQVLPDEKYKIIENLKQEGKKVVMVGDGINDSPALSVADVSIAMKDSSDIAREVADITLLSSDLNDLIVLKNISEKLFKRINANYNFIVGFNTSLILFGIAGFLSPATTALLHNASTIGICATSMRNLLEKKEF